MEIYLKSEKEVLGINWMEGQKNIQLWKKSYLMGRTWRSFNWE